VLADLYPKEEGKTLEDFFRLMEEHEAEHDHHGPITT
jgi:hypothetical protein